MNSNTVLGKIVSLLSSKEEEEVKLAFAKLSDGTILESATFDVGETVEVVSEDGTKSAAPDGEHELELAGAEGETVRFKITTEGGVITERENVEMEEETIETEPLPGDPTEMTEEVALEDVTDESTGEEEQEVTINLEDVAKKVEEMAYRIDELEKKLEEAAEEEVVEEEEMEEETEDKKLDGAPVEMSRVAKSKSNKSANYHQTVLSKLYRN